MILLCTILKVVNGKSFLGLEHQSTDGTWKGANGETQQHNRVIRQPRLLDIRMSCPTGMKFIAGRCRKIL
jgi:hypothetical protein